MTRWLLLGATFLLAWVGVAATPLPPLTGRVVDTAGIFSNDDKAKIDSFIRNLEKASGGQLAVLTVKTLGNEPIEDFSVRLAEKWKIGRKGKDNGAILLIAVDDRRMRLEIGYGWEGDINDARAGDIIRSMAPFFREKQYASGVIVAVAKVQELVTGTRPEGAPEEKTEPALDAFTILSILGFLALFYFFYRMGGGSKGGHFFIGGGHGGGHGGGGFSGGGFRGGGGSFGGGGASGRW